MPDPGQTAYEARFAGEDREDRELLAALEQSLGVQGIAAVFRKSLAMAAEAAASVSADGGNPGAPSEADFLRETIKVVEWQRDNARQERNEEYARAVTAEAEVAKLKVRLENVHAYDGVGKQIPFPAGMEHLDGIACRDETIRNLEDQIAKLTRLAAPSLSKG